MRGSLHSLDRWPFSYGQDIDALTFQVLHDILVILCSNPECSDSFSFHHKGGSDDTDNVHITVFHYFKNLEHGPGFVFKGDGQPSAFFLDTEHIDQMGQR